jgi:hypothetical protein
MDRGFGLSLTAIGRQLAAMPCDRYLVRLIHHASRQALPGERLWTAAHLTDQAVVRFLRARNRDGYDVYFQPFIPKLNAGYIFVDLDNVQPTILDVMMANGHEPCVVIESSPGHLQAWVRVSLRPLTFSAATAIARHLAQLYQADRASADGRHLGRLAGFTNQKPQRRLATGLPPWVKVWHAALVLASQGPALEQVPTLLGVRPQAAFSAPKTAVARADGYAGFSPAVPDAFTPSEAAAIYQTWLTRLRIRQRFASPDWSIVDLWIAKELLRCQATPQRVKTILRMASPLFPRGHADPEDYLRRTLARALQDPAPATFPARSSQTRR